MVDKDLFLHDLSVVTILKDEAPYLKEWLDYHLLAGVEHFYLYNNDSSDDYEKIVAPYVQAGLVTSTNIPGKLSLFPAYTDAVKRFKFFSRYLAFIDLDEFIFPKTNQSISEVVDEILSRDPNAAALSIHWQEFGSNGHEKADYSRGVLERFTRRARKDFYGQFTDSRGNGHTLGNVHLKIVANPRLIKHSGSSHFMIYFENFHAVDENCTPLNPTFASLPIVADKIAVNHYRCKSKEEFEKKWRRGNATSYTINAELFPHFDNNDEFDDGILKYRATRAENFSLESDGQRLDRVIEALVENLSGAEISLEAALTCRALSSYFRERFPNDAEYWKICEEKSLEAILKLLNKFTPADAQLFIRELPNLLGLPYPAVKNLRAAAEQIILHLRHFARMKQDQLGYMALDYLQNILKLMGG